MKNNNFIEKVLEEFDSFMINEYGQWKIGRIEVKQFISQKIEEAKSQQKKEIIEMIEYEFDGEEGERKIILYQIIDEIKNI